MHGRLYITNKRTMEAFGYIVGAVLGDGTVWRRNRGDIDVCLYNLDIGVVTKFCKCARTLGLKYRIKEVIRTLRHPERETWRLVKYYMVIMYSSPIGEIIAKYKQAPYKWRIPKEFINNKSFRTGFLRGLIDTEGCISIIYRRNRKPLIKFVVVISSCYNALAELKNYLELKDNIRLHLNYNNSKKNTYALYTYDRQEILKITSLIKYLAHTRKSKKFTKVLEVL